MSSHREAPLISQDPVADNTDLYAFVSPDAPDTVTLVANFIPFQSPAAGPNFYEFGTDVLYSIYIDNNGDGRPEIGYMLRFTTSQLSGGTFLYNAGPIGSLDDPNWNRRQKYSLTRVDGTDVTTYLVAGGGGKLATTVLGSGLPCPPCNIGPRSTPNYATALAEPAVQTLPGGVMVFAGQRAEGTYLDVGSLFDLLDLRPFQAEHEIPGSSAPGVNALKQLNVHSIALRIPISQLTSDGSVPTDATSPSSVIGVWAAASRRKVRMGGGSNGGFAESGPWVQVSRIGNPYFNAMVVPVAQKDVWNSGFPVADATYGGHVKQPELAKRLVAFYPGLLPNLAALTKARTDLVELLLTGIPAGQVSGFQNFTGSVQADQLRLNLALPPATSPNILGLLGGDHAGYPNGRRHFDDVTAIFLRAIAGATYPFVNAKYTPDAAANQLSDGLTPSSGPGFLTGFPWLQTPHDGFDTPSS